MANKKRKKTIRQGTKQRAATPHSGGIVMFVFFITIVISFYHWGKVQIDFVLRENDRLKQERQTLEQEWNDLRLQVNALRRYDRIVEMAKQQGMVSLQKSNMAELPVELKRQKGNKKEMEPSLRYAGFGLVGIE